MTVTAHTNPPSCCFQRFICFKKIHDYKYDSFEHNCNYVLFGIVSNRSTITLQQHFTNVCASACIELRRKIWPPFVTTSPVTRLTSTSVFVFSWLDYCNCFACTEQHPRISKAPKCTAAGIGVRCRRQHHIIYHTYFLFPSLAPIITSSHLCFIVPFLAAVSDLC